MSQHARRYMSTLAVLLLAATTAHAGDTAPRPLGIDDYGQIKYVGAPMLSPDGKRVAYASGGQISIVPLGGGDTRAVTTGSSTAREPRWSGDGKFLYFLSDRTGKSQLWKLPVNEFGEAMQVTKLARGVSSLQLSADETQLLLTYDDEDPDDSDDEASEPWVVTRMQMKEDAGDGYLTAPASDHLYSYDIASEKLTQVTSGRYAEADAAWSPDGEHIVFVSNREDVPDDSYKSDLWIANTDDPSRPLQRLSDDARVASDPAFSPDGKQVAYLSDEDGVYGLPQLTLVPASGESEPEVVTTALDRWITSFRYSADGKYIYLLFEDHGGSQLARMRMSDRKIERLQEGDQHISAFDLDRKGNLVVLSARGNGGNDLYRATNGKLQRLTEVNREFFAGRKLGHKEKVSYTVADGTMVEAFVTLPPDYAKGQRYPTILKVHGGPVGQFTWGYEFGTQFLASNGYVVVEPNPRGSTGRGQDYVRAIYRSWGITDLPDVLGAVDRAIELGYADPDRLFVTGYSYGGYMTNVVITHSTRFKGAATGAGHSLIEANFGHDIYQKWYNWELGLPSLNREKYDILSPFLRVHEVTTPTLFLGGRQDWNVPILNAELMYQGLQQQGIDTKLVVYPGMHHGGWSARFNKDYLERVVDWFGQHDPRR